MSADARTVPSRPLWRHAGECLALIQDVAAVARLELLLQAIRERRARAGLPFPAANQPQLENTLP